MRGEYEFIIICLDFLIFFSSKVTNYREIKDDESLSLLRNEIVLLRGKNSVELILFHSIKI